MDPPPPCTHVALTEDEQTAEARCCFFHSQVTECLKENKQLLSHTCHQKVFKLQELEMMDPELDYQLMRVCKQMIKVSETYRLSVFAIVHVVLTALKNCAREKNRP